MANGDFLDALQERILVFDGAMGTMIQSYEPTSDDFEGLDGCNEVLSATRSDWIAQIHAAYFEAGADAVETNTFGGSNIVLGEYGIADRVYDLSLRSARIAVESARAFSTPDRPRFAVGSIGPGTKLVSLQQTTFRELADTYGEQVRAFIDGGVDAVVIETCQDILQSKAAIFGACETFREKRVKLPLIAQVTMETTGTMLLGTEIGAALTILEAFDEVDVIGLNCATGPQEMTEHLRFLSRHCSRKLSCSPNAGLPVLRGKTAHYALSPEELAESHARFVNELGVNIVGGCCGTTPAHIRAVADRLWGAAPKSRDITRIPAAASLFQMQPYEQDSSFFIIGERTNANGSKRFREYLLGDDMDGMVEMAQDQVAEGAHALDLCVDYVGRVGARDMERIVPAFNRQITAPLCLDSDTSDGEVYEAALQRYGGKAILNSINFEDGGKKVAKVLPLCKQYGAAVVCLTIDEDGQPHDTEGKVRIARRLYQTAVNEYRMRPEDLFFDVLTFPLGTGQEEYRKDGHASIEAIRTLRSEFPASNFVLGVSNVSFGLKPSARVVLNSVFLHYARQAGLNAAIVHAAKILPLHQIDEKARELARKVIFDERANGFDPLTEFMAFFESDTATAREEVEELGPIEDRLKRHIIRGQKRGLDNALQIALETYEPLEIINDILLDGMKVVGELFASGEMQLPFVLQSAEVMKAAVGVLEPLMERESDQNKGTMVIATVAGDVHDIGKNLVDIILTNNGYKVVNLGIKQHIGAILDAAIEHKADAVGMSGLLVKSTVIMRENLEEMNERKLAHFPVILGGAALTRSYVEDELHSAYHGKVYYAQDAFGGLALMEALTNPDADRSILDRAPVASSAKSHRNPSVAVAASPASRSDVSVEVAIPKPPFYGSQTESDIPLDEVFEFVNEVALFRGQWQFKRSPGMSNPDFNQYLEEHARPVFDRWKLRVKEEHILAPSVVHGYFPVQSEGNDLIVYQDDQRTERMRFTFPRQASNRHLCLADFFAPKETGRMDVAAFQCVTVGSHASQLEKELFASGSYQDYLYLHGLSVETAEALAEYWHRRVRAELGIGHHDAPEIRLLFSTKYQGCRYSFGYPACPNLEDQEKLFELLDPGRIGIELTEQFHLVPEQSTSALICHHPEAKYFNVS